MGLNGPENNAEHIRIDDFSLYLTSDRTGRTYRIDRETRLLTELPRTQPKR